ncbi:MAG: dihydrofolate reductase family protein [Chloroflexota bacterium]
MTNPKGPGSNFQLLFNDDVQSESSLPAPFQEIYPGDWHMPTFDDRPYVYSNFATSRDGRISYQIPGFSGGGDITHYSAHDIWLMGLLRVRADAVMNGDVTVNQFPDSIYSAEDVYPDDAEAFTALRKAEGYKMPRPIFIILSFDGKVNFDSACFQQTGDQIVLATTTKGVSNTKGVQCKSSLDILDLGDEAVDLKKLNQILFSDYKIRKLLCEGGAKVMAGMLEAQLIDEEFVTLSPTFVGRDNEHFRPSYTEGVAWKPDTAPYSKPLSLHRSGDLLYLRTRCQYQR